MWKFKRRKQTLLIPQWGMMAEVERVAEAVVAVGV
jgi:hypothetical protein